MEEAVAFLLLSALLSQICVLQADYQFIPTPTSARKRAALPHHPPPRQPHPQAPTPTPSAQQPLGPHSLVAGQCGLGAIPTLAGRSIALLSDAGRLYVDVGNPANCNGEVIRWELCFVVEGIGHNSITMAVLRMDTHSRGYRIQTVVDVEVENRGESETAGPTCDYIDATEKVLLNRGDLIGFVGGESIRVVFVAMSEGTASNIRVYNISLSNGQRQKRQHGDGNALGTGTLLTSNTLKNLSQNITSLLRVIMNTTDNNVTLTTSLPTPSSTTPHPSPCPTNTNKDGDFSSTLFYSVVITAAGLIFLLLFIILVLCCCLCREKFKRRQRLSTCLQCLGCCNRRRETVIHRITVEPITDQSMMYNEGYVPHNPSHIISGGKRVNTDINNNPAYAAASVSGEGSIGGQWSPRNLRQAAPSCHDSVLSTAECQTEMISKLPPSPASHPIDQTAVPRFGGGLEHTYETIDSSLIRRI